MGSEKWKEQLFAFGVITLRCVFASLLFVVNKIFGKRQEVMGKGR